MAGNTTDEGGAANTPPFPRLVPNPSPERAPTTPEAIAPTPATDPVQAPPSGAARRTGSRPPEPEAAPSDDEAPAAGPSHRAAGGVPRGELRRYAERSVARGCERLADQLDYAAERIARVARNRPATEGPSAPHPAVGWMADSAAYLRSSDLPRIQADLEDRVRARPFQTVLLALGAGWALGRILR